jgi:hypothetical protein
MSKLLNSISLAINGLILLGWSLYAGWIGKSPLAHDATQDDLSLTLLSAIGLSLGVLLLNESSRLFAEQP